MARMRWHPEHISATAIRLTLPLMNRMTQQVLSGAKFLAPRGDHLSGSGRPKKGTPLQPSISSSMLVGPTRIRSKIGSTVNHAATVHQGSQAHTIRSKSGKMLKFRWDRGDFLVAARAGRRRGNRRTGQFHYFVSVRHPGNKRPVRYLTTPLAMFGRLYGFRVSTSGVNRSHLP
jgi:hypothetical protein